MEQNFDTGPGSRENANLTSQALLVAVMRFTASSLITEPSVFIRLARARNLTSCFYKLFYKLSATVTSCNVRKIDFKNIQVEN